MKNILKYLFIIIFLFGSLNAFDTKKISENNNTNKWELTIINKNIYLKSGGLEGKHKIFFKSKKEAKQKIQKIIEQVKNGYLNMAFFISLIFLIFQYYKLKKLLSKLKAIENSGELFKREEEKEELRQKIKFEFYYGLFIILLINIFYIVLTYNYLNQISFSINPSSKF